MKLIIPAAGQSSRFPNVRPKWLLTHPNGNLMLAESIRGIAPLEFEQVYLTVLAEHVRDFDCLPGIQKQFQQIGLGDKLTVVQLEQATQSQPETVARTIEAHDIRGPICVKDSDNYFRVSLRPGNFVSVVDLNNVGFVNPSNKSYATVNESSIVTNIVEKRVISNYFCSGAYGFEESREYLSVYRDLSHLDQLYISHVIYEMILRSRAFSAVICSDYADWGTLRDWNRYKSQFATLFIDVDGTLVKNSGEFFAPMWGSTAGIRENIQVTNRLFDSGKVQIILTTSRKEEFRDVTLAQLQREGVKFHQILFGLNHGKRVVVNDYAKTNPFKSCDAVNIARDSTDLNEMLESVLQMEDNG
ncbi:MAG: hypothetical protein JSS27_09580 [Planctomycetes bacterium]|nr:hypothetical protein [Planctomycetota bacterium]